jgi:hypothetical protein
MRTYGRLATVAAAMATVAALGLGACSSDSEKEANASITACTPGANDGKPVAEGQVTNPSSKSSNYSVRVGFYDGSNNKVTEGADVVTDVESGTSSPFTVTGVGDVKGPVVCKVLGVTRNANPGG